MAKCHSTLIDLPVDGFSPKALRALSEGRRMPLVLDFTRHDLQLRSIEGGGTKTLSISGVQEKVGLKLVRGRLILDERESRYILKPAPLFARFRFATEVPANEHVTMQIAAQIFQISTAANACIAFADGERVYLTRRFDYRGEEKCLQEDFCQVMGRTEQTHGENYKYDGSYEAIADQIKNVCATSKLELIKFFKLILFNYLIGNGDAHMKNFSLMRTDAGDFVLTPAYDLLNTAMLMPFESRTALDLFKDNFTTDSFETNGFYRRIDFEVFGQRLGLPQIRIQTELNHAVNSFNAIERLLQRSFLTSLAQQAYLDVVLDRLKALS